MKSLAVSFACLLIACGPDYERTQIENVKGGTMDTGHLEVTEGGITKARIVVYDDDGKDMPLVIDTSDSEILEARSIVSVHDYAFIGKKAGHARVRLIADDTTVLTIEADVVAQKPLP